MGRRRLRFTVLGADGSAPRTLAILAGGRVATLYAQAGMSVAETHATAALVRRIAADLTILIVEHDMEVVMGLASAITVLNYGEVLAEGTPAEIQANPRVQEVYLKT